MAKKQKDSMRLMWVDAFMAAAAYENYTVAGKVLRRSSPCAKTGKVLGISATSVQRRLMGLQIWLHRILLVKMDRNDLTQNLELTEDGDDFAPIGMKIVNLIDEGGLRDEISITRVQSDGSITIGGIIMKSPVNSEIGRLLISSRATISEDIGFYKRTPIDPKIFKFD